MDIGIYQSAASLSALERWQDSVSQNIASAQMTGYRKRTINFTTQEAGEIQSDPKSRVGSGTADAMLFPKVNTGINFVSGETQPTRRDLDVAIQGDGFFEVKRPDGTLAYTRNGSFQVKADRTIVDSMGDQVMTDSGTPLTMVQGQGDLIINQDGTVFQGTTSLGKISVKQFSDMSQLSASEGGLFIPTGGAQATNVDKPELLQGYLENSNVQPLREMVDLVVISRAYEANQKMITTVDDQMQKTLDALG